MITPNFRIFAAYSHENCCYETVSRHIKIYGQEFFRDTILNWERK